MLEANPEHIYLGSKPLLVRSFDPAVFRSTKRFQAGWIFEILDTFQCPFICPCISHPLRDDDIIFLNLGDDFEIESSMVSNSEKTKKKGSER